MAKRNIDSIGQLIFGTIILIHLLIGLVYIWYNMSDKRINQTEIKND